MVKHIYILNSNIFYAGEYDYEETCMAEDESPGLIFLKSLANTAVPYQYCMNIIRIHCENRHIQNKKFSDKIIINGKSKR